MFLFISFQELFYIFVLHVLCFEFDYSFEINIHFLLLAFPVGGTLPNGKTERDIHTIYERESLMENTKTTQSTGIYQSISYVSVYWYILHS